jgi:hypothetical protein
MTLSRAGSAAHEVQAVMVHRPKCGGCRLAGRGSSSDRKRSRPFLPCRGRIMANVRAERLLKITAEPAPSCLFPVLQLKRE